MPADRLLHPRQGHSQKISQLTDLEYRVWTQYLLTADDFGVMHATAVAIQNANLHLAHRPAKLINRCLETLLKLGLVRRFIHQGQPYLFQPDWQRWQKVEYPRATINPVPTGDDLASCDESTRQLLAKYPGGQRKDRRRAEDVPNDSGRASQTCGEGVPPTRAHGRAERLTANGERPTLTANGSPAVLPTARSKRPMFTGQRLTVFEWMVDELDRLLTPHTEGFDLHEWFFALDARCVQEGIIPPPRDNGAWLKAECLAEAQRRGLPLKVASLPAEDTEAVFAALAKKGPSARP